MAYRDYVPGPLCDYLSSHMCESDYDPCFPPISDMANYGYVRAFRYHRPKNLDVLTEKAHPTILKLALKWSGYSRKVVEQALSLGDPETLESISDYYEQKNLDPGLQTVMGTYNTAIWYLKQGYYDSEVLASAARGPDLGFFLRVYHEYKFHCPTDTVDVGSIILAGNPRALILLMLLEPREIRMEEVKLAFEQGLEMLACLSALSPKTEEHLKSPYFASISSDPRAYTYLASLNIRDIAPQNYMITANVHKPDEIIDSLLEQGYPITRGSIREACKKGDLNLLKRLCARFHPRPGEMLHVLLSSTTYNSKECLEYIYAYCCGEVTENMIQFMNDIVLARGDVELGDWLHKHGLYRYPRPSSGGRR